MSGPPYRPVDSQQSPRFAGIKTFMRLPHVTGADGLEGVDVAAVGIPFDTGTSFRPGPRFGPEAIRSLSALLRPFHPAFGIDLFETLGVVDYGDVPVAPGDTPGSLRRIEEGLAPLVEAGVTTLGLGGDHTITLAELRAHAKRHGPLALVQLDAHADTWDEYFGRRTTTARRSAVLSRKGFSIRRRRCRQGCAARSTRPATSTSRATWGSRCVTADELRALGPAGYGELVRDKVGDRPVFVSFDVDFLDPAFAPGTGHARGRRLQRPPRPSRSSARCAGSGSRARRGRGVAVRTTGLVRSPRSRRRTSSGSSSRCGSSREPAGMSWLGDSAAIACLTFDVDAESPILVAWRRARSERVGDDTSGLRTARRRAADPRAARRRTRCRRRSSSRAVTADR